MIFILQPEPELYSEPSGLGLAFHLAMGLGLVGLVVQEFMRWRGLRQVSELATRAAAAERISATLEILPGLEGGGLRRACQAIVADLMALVDMAYEETTRHACLLRLNSVEAEGKQGKNVRESKDGADSADGASLWRAIREARREAIAIHRRLELAALFLRFGRQPENGRRLTLEAVERHVLAFTPAVQALHEQDIRWRRRIPIFEIRLNGDS